MSNPKDLGNTIAKLRKQAGYSQKQLADALNITDKAVSKWERGLSCPDISLLPKLSAVLDYDIEPLISGISTINIKSWKGILIINEEISTSNMIYDKPMVYYILSIYLLIGITNVLIICSDEEKLKIQKFLNDDIKRFLQIGFSNKLNLRAFNSNIFLITNQTFLFAASLTRQLQAFISSCDEIVEIIQDNGKKTFLYFIPQNKIKCIAELSKKELLFWLEKNEKKQKRLGRGTVYIPLLTYDDVQAATTVVYLQEKYSQQKIGDVLEIAKNRKLLVD